MDLVVTQVVRAVPVSEPGELKEMGRRAVSEVYKLKASVFGVFCAGHGQSQRFFIECERFLKIIYIQIVVCKSKFHGEPPL